MNKLPYTLIALRLVLFVLGIFLGMGYTAWVLDRIDVVIMSLMMSVSAAPAWLMIELDLKDQIQ
jgi:ABC-type dipeptide/oligopeptide/nickel transport system permease component